jgi:PAS domain S-box-containing protein
MYSRTCASDGAVATLAGFGCLLLASICAYLAITIFRRDCKRLTEVIQNFARGEPTTLVDTNERELAPLVTSINDLVSYAESSVTDAAMKLKELEIQLKVATAQRQHAEAILYSISDAVLVTDVFDQLVLANEAAARTFDFDLSKVESQRRPVDSVLRDEKLISMMREMRQSKSINGRRIIEHEVAIDGQKHTFKCTLSCVTDQVEEPAGVVAVLHDMTKEKEVAEMKNDFVSNVSHELRTPLASIKAYVEMLIDGEADDEKTKREFYDVIQNEANRLGRLIDNIVLGEDAPPEMTASP